MGQLPTAPKFGSNNKSKAKAATKRMHNTSKASKIVKTKRFILSSLVTNTQVAICITRIALAALKDVRLTNHTLLMPINNYDIQW